MSLLALEINKPPNFHIYEHTRLKYGDCKHTIKTGIANYYQEKHSIILEDDEKNRKVRMNNRLDYFTSGIMVVSLTRETAALTARCFRNKVTFKQYVAVVEGHLSEYYDTERTITARLNDKKNRVTANSFGSKHAETRVVVLTRGTMKGEPVTKVLLTPKTGRRHQLRVHMKYIGYIIVGDLEYKCNPNLSSDRMFLHSLHTKLPLHPYADDVSITTPDPFLQDTNGEMYDNDKEIWKKE
eukprot:gb/GECH01004609.1/.p1 GENE.gb/GECH01004609.1/~~gb/GECH01004609.1/.p1  ORF type:complete len:240 (+),score=41.09 gb/GECH01004609.1/:1-720(+)